MISKLWSALAIVLAISASADAAIIDLGTVTRDTETGLDWLDLTETIGRSYDDVSSKLGIGQEFEGWRYATFDETQTLWMNLGFEHGTMEYIPVTPCCLIWSKFINAVELLGNTVVGEIQGITYDYGSIGVTGDNYDTLQMRIVGAWHEAEPRGEVAYTDQGQMNRLMSSAHISRGHYLVTDTAVIPLPGAALLFGSGLFGLVAIKRKRFL